jgi:tetratricopeptide (TPR) repeat protein
MIALFAAPGCATSRPDPELENRAARANSHFEVGIDHLGNQRYALGLRELRSAESLDPKNPRIQAGLAQAYLHKGRADEAEAHLLRALAIDPEYHDARLNLSALYLLTERYPEAAEQARVLVDDPTFPGVWRAYANLAVAEISQENYAAARENADLALDFNPTYWPAFLALGILEHKQGRMPEAISYFKQTLEQKPAPGVRAEANYYLAEIYVSVGNRDRAVGHLMTAVAQTPDGEWGKKSEEYLKILR